MNLHSYKQYFNNLSEKDVQLEHKPASPSIFGNFVLSEVVVSAVTMQLEGDRLGKLA